MLKFIHTAIAALVLLLSSPLFSNQECPKIGIVVACFNRPEYLTQTLQNLQEKQFGDGLNIELVIIDDCGGEEAESLIDSFHRHDVLVMRIRLPKNSGIAKVLSFGWKLLSQRGCDYLCNLDSDVILKDNWLQTLYTTYQEASDLLNRPNLILTGFNTKNHRIKMKYPSFYIKKSLGGINLFFPTEMYHKCVSEALKQGNQWDWTLVTLAKLNRIPLICTKPSVIQHIGINSSIEDRDGYDVAEDF